MKEEEIKQILEIKQKLEEAGLEKEIKNLLFCPIVPCLGIEKSYVIEEIMGIKVARLISVPEED